MRAGGPGGAVSTLRESSYVGNAECLDSQGNSTAMAVFRVASAKEYLSPDNWIETRFGYKWHSCDNTKVLEQTTILPVVPESQNGPGGTTGARRIERYDEQGRPVWLCDERGRVSYRRYDQERNALVKTIQDVNSGGLPSGVSLPAGWPDNVDALNIETDFTVDEFGRVTESLGPAHTIDEDGTALEVRAAAWTAYDEGGRRTISSRGYKAVGTGQITVVNPVSVTQRDEFGQVTDERQVVRSAGLKNTLVSVSETFADQTGWCRWTHQELDAWGQVTGTRVYHDIPASGSGTEGPDANYNQSRFAHDWAGRQYKQTSPGGTITWTTFDGRGRATGVYVGNDDTGGTAADPTNGDSNHMRLVTSYEYDGGGAGDGNRTGITQHVDGNPANDRVTTFAFDSRNRAVRETSPPDDAGRVTYVQTTYDNLDRATRVEKYQVSSSGDVLLARSDTDFDSRGQAWRTLVYPVSGGIAGSNALIGYTWHDEAGNAIKSAARRVEAVHEDGVRRCRPGHGHLRGLRSGRTDRDRRHPRGGQQPGGRCHRRADENRFRRRRPRDQEHRLRPETHQHRHRRPGLDRGPSHPGGLLVRRGRPPSRHGQLRHRHAGPDRADHGPGPQRFGPRHDDGVQ